MNDTNKVIHKLLSSDAGIIALVGTRVYCPRAPENTDKPFLTFKGSGGTGNPYIPDIPEPAVQIDCWAEDLKEAREIYWAVYSLLQGLQGESVTIGANTYRVLSAIEEVAGQDLEDVDIPGLFRVVSYYRFIIEA